MSGKSKKPSDGKNSLAAVLSKLQQIKTKGSIDESGSPASAEDTGAPQRSGALDEPPSEKIVVSADKTLYKFVFGSVRSRYEMYVSLPFAVDPVMLPDPPIPNDVPSEEVLEMCPVCRMSFYSKDGLPRHLARKSIEIRCTCDRCASSDPAVVFYNKCKFYSHLIETKVPSNPNAPLDLTQTQIVPLKPSNYPKVTQEWYQALMAGATSTEALIREKISKIVEGSKQKDQETAVDLCPICTKHVPNVFEHLQKYVALEEQNCRLCLRTSLLNSCAFTAHQALHVNPLHRVCPECGLFVEDIADFNHHLKVCHHLNKISGFRCIKCNLNFTKIPIMVDHVTLKHSELFFKCSECSLAFKNEQSVISHYKSTHGININTEAVSRLTTLCKCSVCQELMTGSDQLKDHVESSHVSLSLVKRFFYFRCQACSKVYESKAELNQHVTAASDEPHDALKAAKAVCDVCHKTFPSHSDLLAHRAAEHSDALAQYTPPKPVIHRSNNVPDESDWSSPRDECGTAASVQCVSCIATFSQPYQLEIHRRLHHHHYPCPLCQQVINGTLKMDAHLTTTHDKSSVKSAFLCVVCSLTFDTISAKNHHLTLFHGWPHTERQGLEKAYAGQINRVECKACSIVFRTLDACRDHFEKTHPSGFNFACVTCSDGNANRIFGVFSDFMKHQASVHAVDNPIPAKVPRLESSR